MSEKPDHLGHRKRLRERFLKGGAEALSDHELIELVLFLAQPRRDTKSVAKALIRRFGSFANAISAEPQALREVAGMGEASIAALKSVQAAALRLIRSEVADRPVIGSWNRLLDYCRASMGRDKVEQFRLLFLDTKNRLIADESQQTGTVNHTPVYPREVVKRALALGASAIIMVHNHPSGDATPSRDDIDMTRAVRDACEKLGIAVHDHVIITSGEHASLRNLGLI